MAAGCRAEVVSDVFAFMVILLGLYIVLDVARAYFRFLEDEFLRSMLSAIVACAVVSA